MRFWWPGSRTPTFLMSLQAGGREGGSGAGTGGQLWEGGLRRGEKRGTLGIWQGRGLTEKSIS